MNKHCIDSTIRVAALRGIARAPRRLPLSMALAAALAAGFLAPSGAGATTFTWTGVGGNATWGNGKNWSTPCVGTPNCTIVNLAPAEHSSVLFNSNVPATIYGVPTGNGFDNITFGISAAATTFEMDSGGGAIGLSGGIVNASGKKQIFKFRIDAQGDQTWDGGPTALKGVQVNNTGDLNYSLNLKAGVTMVNVGNVTTKVGTTGTGTLTLGIQSSLAAPEVLLGEQYGSSGTVNLTDADARLTPVGNLIVGFAGTGNLNILSGQASSAQAFIGMNYGGQGTVLIDGAASKLAVSGNLEVGRAGTGTLTVQNGGLLSSVDSFIGRSLGGDGLVVLKGTGSSWASSGNLTVGDTGVGSVRVEAGAKLNSVGATLGNQAGSAGLAKVTGAQASWTATGKLQIGNQGEGFLSVEQGGLLSTTGANLGTVGDAGTSTALVTGSGSRWQSAGDLRVDSGTLTLAEGGVINADKVNFGETSGSAALVNLSGTGTALNVTGQFVIGSSTGTGTVTLGTGATLNAAGQLLIWKGGVLNLDGGTLNAGWTINQGQVNWNSGTVNFLGAATTGNGLLAHSTGLGMVNINVADTLQILSGDDLSLNGGQANALGLAVAGDLAIGSFSQLSVGAAGGLVSGSLQLAGGTISSVGRLESSGLVSGYGVIAGTGGFVNSGLLRQGDGAFVLSNTGTNLNTGTWEMQAGRSLTLNADLNNGGTLALNGGNVVGAGVLVNQADGTISGSGRIASGFFNQGSLVVDAGRLQIDPSFTNRGQILLGSNAATLAGGQVGNHGLIQGLGKITSNISNVDPIGVIEAQGGTLTLSGLIVSPNGGILAAGTGAKLLISQGLASNAGKVQLAGGTLDNNGRTLSNEVAGIISGYGTLRGGLLTNNGRVLLSGGTSAVYTPIVSTNASQIVASGNSNTTFYATVDVQSGAELRVSTGSVATFFELVQQRTGSKFTGSGAKRFEGGVAVGASPGLGTDEGDVEFGDSNTYFAEIGGTSACTLACGTDEALKNRSFDKYIVAGSLTFGGTLKLSSWNGFTAQSGQRFDLFDWGTASGTFSSIDASGLQLAAGTKLDYSALYTTGEIVVTTAVPEPESYALLLAGLGVIGFVARRRAQPRG